MYSLIACAICATCTYIHHIRGVTYSSQSHPSPYLITILIHPYLISIPAITSYVFFDITPTVELCVIYVTDRTEYLQVAPLSEVTQFLPMRFQVAGADTNTANRLEHNTMIHVGSLPASLQCARCLQIFNPVKIQRGTSRTNSFCGCKSAKGKEISILLHSLTSTHSRLKKRQLQDIVHLILALTTVLSAAK